MARLPQPGGDNGNWGTILNEYLSQSHSADGSLKDGVISESKLSSAAQIKLNQLAPTWNTLGGKPAVVAAGADQAAVRAVIDAERSFQINAKDWGAVGDNIADDTAPLQAALNAAPNGATVFIPSGTYKLTVPLTVTDKTLTIQCPTAEFVCAIPGAAFIATATTDTIYDVDSLSVVAVSEEHDLPGVLITLNDGAAELDWTRGDVVKLVSDDVIPGVNAGSNGQERRTGQFFTVESVGMGSATVYGELYDPMTTNIRVARIKSEYRVKIIGGTWRATSSFNGAMRFINMVAPEIIDVDLTVTAGPAVVFNGCIDYKADVTVNYAPNNPSSQIFGYGI